MIDDAATLCVYYGQSNSICPFCNYNSSFLILLGRYINGKKSNVPASQSNLCIGLYKRFHLCNEQACPEADMDFREEQCIKYNTEIFQGKRYVWESYIKGNLNYILARENIAIYVCSIYVPQTMPNASSTASPLE
jgi:hypothetical protein